MTHDLIDNTTTINSCPLCGGEPLIGTTTYPSTQSETWEQHVYFYMYCLQCQASNFGFRKFATIGEAVLHWNNLSKPFDSEETPFLITPAEHERLLREIADRADTEASLLETLMEICDREDALIAERDALAIALTIACEVIQELAQEDTNNDATL